jgi:anti-anti-sigma factor
MDRAETTYRIDGDTLVVAGHLEAEEDEELRRWCLDLLLTEKEVVKLDLTGVRYISSLCVGVLATLWIDLSVAKRSFVLQPSAEVKKILDLSGLSKVFLGGA